MFINLIAWWIVTPFHFLCHADKTGRVMVEGWRGVVSEPCTDVEQLKWEEEDSG